MSETRPIAVGITPLETRRDVVVDVARRAEELGYAAIYVAEGWGHDAAVLLAEIALKTTPKTVAEDLERWYESGAEMPVGEGHCRISHACSSMLSGVYRLRHTRRGWEEEAPTHCPVGHPLGPRQALVGSRNCECGTPHRTHLCVTCERVVYTPALGKRCRMRDLDGR